MSKTITTTTVTTTVVETQVAPTKARLVFVLDRSGSMNNIKNEAIGGFNAFVDGQKKVPGEADITLVIFDNIIETIHSRVGLNHVPVLTEEVYTPRGMTALYDAIGVTITKCLEEKVSDDTKTILAILTDGEENSSKEFSGSTVASLISKVEKEHNWEVLFLGANIDVQKMATTLNIQGGKFASFTASAKGMADTYSALNSAATTYRSMGAAACAAVDMQDLYDTEAAKQ